MEKYLNADKSNKKALPKYIIKFNHLLKNLRLINGLVLFVLLIGGHTLLFVCQLK